MSGRKDVLLLTLVMMVVATSVGLTVLVTLYQTAFDQQRDRLVETAQSQARLIEAVARFDAQYSAKDVPGGAFSATLRQIRDAHKHFKGFGKSGEFTLAKREGDQIVFLLRHRHDDLKNPKPVPFSSELAEPMRQALSGKSGIIVGVDYRGEQVLAAFEPVKELNLGIVAKIDLTEIRAPFVRAGGLAGGGGFILIMIGIFFSRRISNPLIHSLQESERKYRGIFEFAADGLLLMDLQGKILEANPPACAIYGYSKEEFIGRDVKELIHSDCHHLLEPALERLAKGKTFSTESVDRRKDGTSFPVEVHLSPVHHEGQKAIISAFHDITERKQMQERLKKDHDEMEKRVQERTRELRESRTRLETILHTAADGIITINESGLIESFNKAAEQIFGYTANEAIGKKVNILMPEPYRREHDEYIASYLKTGQAKIIGIGREFVGQRKDGTIFPMELAVSEARLENRVLFTGIVRDLSERKQAQETAARFGQILDNSLNEIYIFNSKTLKFIEVNQGARKNLGYSMEELQNLTPLDLKPHFTREDFMRRLEPLQTGEKERIRFETLHRRKDGSLYPIEVHVQISSSYFLPVYVAIILDITERKQAEESFVQSQERLNLALKGAELGIWDWNIQADEIFHDQRSVEMLGYTMEEFTAAIHSWEDLLHPDDMSRVINDFNSHLDGKSPFYKSEHRLLTKSGQWIWVLDSGKISEKDKKGRPLRMTGTHLDITARKEMESKFKVANLKLQELARHLESVREEEKVRIAREIHDELGQVLTAVKMEVGFFKREIPKNRKKLLKRISSVSDLIISTIDSVQKISTNLRPRVLDELGLIPAIEWLAMELKNRTGIKFNLTVSSKEVNARDELSITIFRICQEILTNVAKHSNASKVSMQLQKKNGVLELIIEDNGRGITQSEISSFKSHGITGIKERVMRWQGKVYFQGNPGKGTRVWITLPLSE